MAWLLQMTYRSNFIPILYTRVTIGKVNNNIKIDANNTAKPIYGIAAGCRGQMILRAVHTPRKAHIDIPKPIITKLISSAK